MKVIKQDEKLPQFILDAIVKEHAHAQLWALYAIGWRDINRINIGYPEGHINHGADRYVCHAWKIGEPEAKWEDRPEFSHREALELIDACFGTSLVADGNTFSI